MLFRSCTFELVVLKWEVGKSSEQNGVEKHMQKVVMELNVDILHQVIWEYLDDKNIELFLVLTTKRVVRMELSLCIVF